MKSVLDAVGQTAPLLQTRGQMIEVKQEGATGLRVMADRRRILQVIINLLNNASKLPDRKTNRSCSAPVTGEASAFVE